MIGTLMVNLCTVFICRCSNIVKSERTTCGTQTTFQPVLIVRSTCAVQTYQTK